MPAEAIHLSALDDTVPRANAKVRHLLEANFAAARVGALFVDYAYFDNFASGVVRYLLNLPPAPSVFGDHFHRKAPIAVARELASAAMVLSRALRTQDEGAWLSAFVLGYVSHAAVDRSIHPLVNRLAAERALRFGDAHSRQHQEVEKYQSILFHHERHGFDFMGTPTLREKISVKDAPLSRPGPISECVTHTLARLWGQGPAAADFARFSRGYRQYGWLISTPLGKRVAPPAAKERERPALYDQVNFQSEFARAVDQSLAYVNAFGDFLCDGRADASAQAELERRVPEGTLDPGAPDDQALAA